MVSPYLPHVLYAVALTSISIHIVGHRRTSEEEKSRTEARVSLLESIRDQLRSSQPISVDELERLKKLARPPDPEAYKLPAETIGWKDIFTGRKPTGQEPELSKWDRKDLEIFKTAFENKK